MRDPLIDLLIRNGGAGVLAGWLTVGLLLGLDVRGLGALVLASDVWPLPLIMLLAFFAITFGGAAMAAAIMGLNRQSGAASNPLRHQTRILRFDPKTETFESFPSPRRGASVPQILGREGEVWAPGSGTDHLVVLRTR